MLIFRTLALVNGQGVNRFNFRQAHCWELTRSIYAIKDHSNPTVLIGAHNTNVTVIQMVAVIIFGDQNWSPNKPLFTG